MGNIFPEPCRQGVFPVQQKKQMGETILCHSLHRETEKGALIDSQRLSIQLRGRALWRGKCE